MWDSLERGDPVIVFVCVSLGGRVGRVSILGVLSVTHEFQ